MSRKLVRKKSSASSKVKNEVSSNASISQTASTQASLKGRVAYKPKQGGLKKPKLMDATYSTARNQQSGFKTVGEVLIIKDTNTYSGRWGRIVILESAVFDVMASPNVTVYAGADGDADGETIDNITFPAGLEIDGYFSRLKLVSGAIMAQGYGDPDGIGDDPSDPIDDDPVYDDEDIPGDGEGDGDEPEEEDIVEDEYALTLFDLVGLDIVFTSSKVCDISDASTPACADGTDGLGANCTVSSNNQWDSNYVLIDLSGDSDITYNLI